MGEYGAIVGGQEQGVLDLDFLAILIVAFFMLVLYCTCALSITWMINFSMTLISIEKFSEFLSYLNGNKTLLT